MNNIALSLNKLTSSCGSINQNPVELTAATLSNESEFAKYQESVVRITGEVWDPLTNQTTQTSLGSGVIVSPDGLVVSAKHVFKDECPQLNFMAKFSQKYERIQELMKTQGISFFAEIPKLSDGSEIEMLRIPLKVLKQSGYQDILVAALDLEQRPEVDNRGSYHPVTFNPQVPGFGESVYTIGHPRGSDHNVLTRALTINGKAYDAVEAKKLFEILDKSTRWLKNQPFKKLKKVPEFFTRELGVIENEIDEFRELKEVAKGDLIYSENDIEPGNSGGLLADEEGQLVGITVQGRYKPLKISEFFGKKYQPVTQSETSDSVIQFIRESIPNLDLDKLLGGDEVNTPDLIRESSKEPEYQVVDDPSKFFRNKGQIIELDDILKKYF